MTGLDDIRAGGKPALARALAAIEQSPEDPAVVALLDVAYAAPAAWVVGMTGPPGVGKSTLMNALIGAWRREGRRVGCVAVDPSSQRSGGALLGDRIRLATDPLDEGVFVRSMAARGHLGGLAVLTMPTVVLMRALFDMVLVETVGVGQSETEVAGLADTVVLCVQPGSGDSIQYMKAGIAEIPHVAVVTKADMGAPARRSLAELRAALALAGEGGDAVAVLAVSAATGEGVTDLAAAVDRHAAAETGGRAERRHRQAEAWLAGAVRERFGREGERRAGPLVLAPGESPFTRMAQIASKLLGAGGW